MIDKKNDKLSKIILYENSTIKNAIDNLIKSEKKVCAVLNKKRKFIGIITDGDIRRALLKKISLDDNILKITNRKCFILKKTVPENFAQTLMRMKKIYFIPLVDKKKKLKDFYFYEFFNKKNYLSNYIVIMAGGRGERLKPLTNNIPKPMLIVRNKPIIEHIIVKAKSEGFKNIIICTHYLSKKIKNYFKNGERFGLNINYVTEKKPLGTAGSLKYLKNKTKEPFIVTYGDVLTDISFSDILKFHKIKQSVSTMAILNKEEQVQFGIVKTSGYRFMKIDEKPIYTHSINAGTYVISPEILKFIPKNFYHMTTLFEQLKNKKKKVYVYPIHENWHDVGNFKTYHMLK